MALAFLLMMAVPTAAFIVLVRGIQRWRAIAKRETPLEFPVGPPTLSFVAEKLYLEMRTEQFAEGTIEDLRVSLTEMKDGAVKVVVEPQLPDYFEIERRETANPDEVTGDHYFDRLYRIETGNFPVLAFLGSRQRQAIRDLQVRSITNGRVIVNVSLGADGWATVTQVRRIVRTCVDLACCGAHAMRSLARTATDDSNPRVRRRALESLIRLDDGETLSREASRGLLEDADGETALIAARHLDDEEAHKATYRWVLDGGQVPIATRRSAMEHLLRDEMRPDAEMCLRQLAFDASADLAGYAIDRLVRAHGPIEYARLIQGISSAKTLSHVETVEDAARRAIRRSEAPRDQMRAAALELFHNGGERIRPGQPAYKPAFLGVELLFLLGDFETLDGLSALHLDGELRRTLERAKIALRNESGGAISIAGLEDEARGQVALVDGVGALSPADDDFTRDG